MPLERLDILPNVTDIYSWADYFELRALVHPDKCYTRGDFLTLVKQLDSIGQSAPDAPQVWRDTKEFIRNRNIVFGDAYPFSILGRDEDVLALPDDAYSEGQRLYLTMLICSSMAYVKRAGGHVQILGRLFEECSLEIFSRLVPAGSEIHPAWAGAGGMARYTGTLPEKFRTIAKDIRAYPTFQDRDFSKNDHGDGGIDIVSWHPMGDKRVAIPTALAQCGCSREAWRTKHVAASPTMLRNKLNVFHQWATYYFMPLDLRAADGDWAHKSDFGDAILVDRLRIISLARQYGLYSAMPIRTIVDEAAALNVM